MAACALLFSNIPASAATPESLFASSVPATTSDPDGAALTVGLRFTAKSAGSITAVRFYKGSRNTGTHIGAIYSTSGALMAKATVTNESSSGWQSVSLATPLAVTKGATYTAAVYMPVGHYGVSDPYTWPVERTNVTGVRGTYSYGTGLHYPTQTYQRSNYFVDVSFLPGAVAASSPTTARPTTSATPPTPTPTATATPASGKFPDASNTGVPAGTSLSAYTGPMTITVAGTVIDGKTITGTLVIAAPNVTVKRSKLVGHIDSDQSGASVTVADSEVDGGTSSTPALGYGNLNVSRVNVHGSRVSVLCGSNCSITDTWLHGQYMAPNSAWHVNGYVSNGGSHVTVRHNTIACDVQDNSQGGGCTGPAASFGDFGPLRDITYDNNLFVASPGGYCLAAGLNPSKPYGSDPTGIIVKNNVFQRGPNGRCASFGPATSWNPQGVGNVWTGNTWDSGGVVGAP